MIKRLTFFIALILLLNASNLTAVYGVAAVAAFGIGSRIEILAITPFMALSSVLVAWT